MLLFASSMVGKWSTSASIMRQMKGLDLERKVTAITLILHLVDASLFSCGF